MPKFMCRGAPVPSAPLYVRDGAGTRTRARAIARALNVSELKQALIFTFEKELPTDKELPTGTARGGVDIRPGLVEVALRVRDSLRQCSVGSLEGLCGASHELDEGDSDAKNVWGCRCVVIFVAHG